VTPPLPPADGAGGDGHQALPEHGSSEGRQHRAPSQDEPGEGGQWPGRQEETVAEEEGDEDGAVQGGGLAGPLQRPGDGEEGQEEEEEERPGDGEEGQGLGQVSCIAA
jgi:hypothetical protein